MKTRPEDFGPDETPTLDEVVAMYDQTMRDLEEIPVEAWFAAADAVLEVYNP